MIYADCEATLRLMQSFAHSSSVATAHEAQLDEAKATGMDPDEYEAVFRHATSVMRYPALERLICIALADPDFKTRLLSDTMAAVDSLHEDLQLSHAEREVVGNVAHAVDIYDFAAQLHYYVQQRTS